jgi:MoxR-like ATPase
MSKISLNVKEVKNFVNYILDNNNYLQENNKVPVAVEIIGEAGIGKTSSIMQIATERDLHLVKLNLAQIEELGDLVGFPLRQFELCKTKNTTATIKKSTTPVTKEITVMEKKITKKQVLENGKFIIKEIVEEVPVKKLVKEPVVEEVMDTPPWDEDKECLWIDEQAVDEYLKRGYEFTGNKRMSYCPPEWIADKGENGILLLDDFSRADLRFTQAAMELIDKQTYLSWKLPKGWTIILTSNPDNGNYFVTSLDTAQKTRFISIDIKFDVECWAEWAEQTGIDG